MLQEEHSLSEDKPPSYIDLHTHSFMTGDGVLRVQNIFPDVSGESSLPEHFSIGIHPKNIDPEYLERELAIMADSTIFPWWIPPLRNRSLPLRSSWR